jgi:hypothetical protein
MKNPGIGAFVSVFLMACLCPAPGQAGYGGGQRPRYGGSPRPGPGYGGSAQPGKAAPAAPKAPESGSTNKFSALPLRAGFYFLPDTNRTVLWTKVSPGTASNAVTHKIVPVMSATPVRSQ